MGNACVCKEGSPAKGKAGDRSRIQAAPPSPGAVGMVGRRARPKTDAPKSKQAFAQSNHSPHRADVREHGHVSLQNHCSCSSHHVRCSPCAAKPLRAYTTVGRMGAWSRAAATIGYIRFAGRASQKRGRHHGYIFSGAGSALKSRSKRGACDTPAAAPSLSTPSRARGWPCSHSPRSASVLAARRLSVRDGRGGGGGTRERRRKRRGVGTERNSTGEIVRIAKALPRCDTLTRPSHSTGFPRIMCTQAPV